MRKRIKVKALEEKAHLFERFAYDSPDKNRVIGSEGHQATIDYITKTVKEHSKYYDVYQQPIPLAVGISANLTVNGKETAADAVGLAPGGHVSGPVRVIPNLGCEEVSMVSEEKSMVTLTKVCAG